MAQKKVAAKVEAVTIDSAKAEVAKSRRALIAALLATIVVAGAIAGVAYYFEIGPFAPIDVVATPQDPAESSESTSTTATPAASSATVPLPSSDAQESMYWEQVASRETIEELVNDKFATFEIGEITTAAERADIRVRATYRDGSSMSGWLVLRQYEGAWYFAMISADGRPATTPVSGDPDADVVRTVVEQQAANQEIYRAILDGAYTTITVSRVTAGSGTAMMDIELAGGSAPQAKGQIVCVSKIVKGTTHWFITSFSKL